MRTMKGTLAAVNDELGMECQGLSRLSVELAWTEVTGDTIVFEAKTHQEGSWGSIEGYPVSDMDGTGVTSVTGVGAWVFDVRAIAAFRVKASALGAQDVTVYLGAV
jgi:hypothetical protein